MSQTFCKWCGFELDTDIEQAFGNHFTQSGVPGCEPYDPPPAARDGFCDDPALD